MLGLGLSLLGFWARSFTFWRVRIGLWMLVLLGVCGLSYLELLILYEQWAGKRLVLEKAVPSSRRAGRPISVSAVLVGPGNDILRTCRFLGSVLRFLDRLRGSLGRFLPCWIRANHCGVQDVGWDKCGHGLYFPSWGDADPGFLDLLLLVVGVPLGLVTLHRVFLN